MKAYAVVFDYPVEFCYECGNCRAYRVDKIFLTEEKANQRLNKLSNKKENKGKVKIEYIIIGE